MIPLPRFVRLLDFEPELTAVIANAMPPTSDSKEPNHTAGPILLFGSPRSGTTWLGKIFDSHPQTLYRHEPDSWGLLNWMPLAPDIKDAEQYAVELRRFVADLPASRETKVAASLPLFRKDYYNPLQQLLTRVSVSAAKVVARGLGEVRVPSWAPANERSARVVWKSIESVARLGVAARVVPGARAILILRNPCGYVGSVLRGEKQKRFTGEEAASEDYGLFEVLSTTDQARRYGIDARIAQDLHPAERMAWIWAIVNEKAIEDTKALENVRLLVYESLCADPLNVSRELFTHCNLDWNNQTEWFLGTSTSRNKEGYYSVFKDPHESAQRWRKELDRDVQRRVMDVATRTTLAALFQE